MSNGDFGHVIDSRRKLGADFPRGKTVTARRPIVSSRRNRCPSVAYFCQVFVSFPFASSKPCSFGVHGRETLSFFAITREFSSVIERRRRLDATRGKRGSIRRFSSFSPFLSRLLRALVLFVRSFVFFRIFFSFFFSRIGKRSIESEHARERPELPSADRAENLRGKIATREYLFSLFSYLDRNGGSATVKCAARVIDEDPDLSDLPEPCLPFFSFWQF